MDVRSTDNNPDAARFARIRTARHKFNVFYTVLAAGIVSLIINWGFDATQRGRSLENCNLIQEDRRAEATILERDADQVLGNAEKGIIPLDLEHTAFAEFAPIIIAEAKANRIEAEAMRARVRDCNDIFPKFDIPFFG